LLKLAAQSAKVDHATMHAIFDNLDIAAQPSVFSRRRVRRLVCQLRETRNIQLNYVEFCTLAQLATLDFLTCLMRSRCTMHQFCINRVGPLTAAQNETPMPAMRYVPHPRSTPMQNPLALENCEDLRRDLSDVRAKMPRLFGVIVIPYVIARCPGDAVPDVERDDLLPTKNAITRRDRSIKLDFVAIYGIILVAAFLSGELWPIVAYQTPPIVMDTNVLVAGACRHEGSFAYRVLLAVLQRQVPLMLTQPIALEYLDVLQRSRIQALTGLTHKQSAELVADLVSLSHEVQVNFVWRPNLADERDNEFVEAAIHTGATIVTYNERDFLIGDMPRFGWSVMNAQEFATRYL
jgi:predicted nucleic acid-binding protein